MFVKAALATLAFLLVITLFFMSARLVGQNPALPVRDETGPEEITIQVVMPTPVSGETAPASSDSTAPVVQSGSTNQPEQPSSTGGNVSASTIFSPAEAEKWCTGPCSGRFEPLPEANGTINPNGVHMITGDPVKLSVPAGYTVDVWDCYNGSKVSGPATLNQVCEASIRRTK